MFRRNISPPSSDFCLLSAFTLVSCSVYSSTLKNDRYVPPKRQLTLNGLHGVISQKIVLFTYLWSVLILSIYLRLALPSGLFPSGFWLKLGTFSQKEDVISDRSMSVCLRKGVWMREGCCGINKNRYIPPPRLNLMQLLSLWSYINFHAAF
jgi:hypothetical protein